MAGDELKDDVNNATSSFKMSSMTFCMCVGLKMFVPHQLRRVRLPA